jgi:phage FluMu protein Com
MKRLREVCAWCNKLMAEGDAPTPISHGCCPTCMEQVLAQDEFETNRVKAQQEKLDAQKT